MNLGGRGQLLQTLRNQIMTCSPGTQSSSYQPVAAPPAPVSGPEGLGRGEPAGRRYSNPLVVKTSASPGGAGARLDRSLSQPAPCPAPAAVSAAAPAAADRQRHQSGGSGVQSSSTRSLTSPVAEVPDNPTDCQCNRKKGTIVCNSCGSETAGRKSISCPIHPQNCFLMDYAYCPVCQSADIFEVV